MGQHRRVNAVGRSARALALLSLLAPTAAVSCRQKTEAPPPPASAAAPASQRPLVDSVLPGELAEGTELAFGLPIPRRMKIRVRFPDEVIAVGNIPPEQVSNFVRQRVVAAGIETGPAKTVFSRAAVKSSPERMLRIEVITHSSATELVVRDQTTPPALVNDGLSEEERWRRKGLKPDGSPLDPTHLE